MGNYYKRHRLKKWQQNGKGKGKKLFFGGIIIIILVVTVYALGDSSFSKTLKSGQSVITSAVSSAVSQGKTLLSDSAIDLAVPVSSGVVVEEFGIVSDAEGQEAYHNGIDIRVPAESEVLAAADGKISDVSTHDDGTVWITVAHQKNWSTVYGRLGEAKVVVGDEVKKGDVIGVPANEILHFEVLEDKTEKDPVQYFEKGA